MTAWGQMRAGKLILAEAHTASRKQHETIGTKSITVAGTEYTPGSVRSVSEAVVAALAEDIIWLKDQFIAVSFSNKPEMNGYYTVMDSGVEYTKWVGEAMSAVWAMDLQFIGPAEAVDIETRFSNVTRANGFAITAERWHAPAVGHYAYYTGTAAPSGSVVRSSAYGNITVYRGIPTGINPRWGCPVAQSTVGRVVIASGGIERAAINCNIPTTTWALDNGIVRIAPLAASGLLNIGVWNGSGYDNKAWNLQRAGVSIALSSFSACTILRNSMDAVTLRLVRDRAPGRDLVDITLRRGARFAEILYQTDSSATLGLTLQTSETQTDVTGASGYVTATGDDGFGDRYIAGSSKASVTAVAGGGLQKAAVTALDFYVGVVFNGGAAVSGDQAANLRDQYVGTMSAREAGVKR